MPFGRRMVAEDLRVGRGPGRGDAIVGPGVGGARFERAIRGHGLVLYQQHPAFASIKGLGVALEERLKTLSIVIILPPNSRFSGLVVHSLPHLSIIY